MPPFTRLITALLLFLAAPATPAAVDVDLRSGTLEVTATDLSLPAGAIQLDLQRSLQPSGSGPGLLGRHWRLSWEQRLLRSGDFARIGDGPNAMLLARGKGGGDYRGAGGQRLGFDARGAARLSLPDGSSTGFDADGRMVERLLPGGNRITASRDPDGRLLRLSGPYGRQFQFSYEPAGRLTRVTAGGGIQVDYVYQDKRLAGVNRNGFPLVRYAYDASGRLSGLQESGGPAQGFTYDEQGRLSSRSEAGTAVASYSYGDNRVTVTDAGGGETHYGWSADGLYSEMTDPLGHKTLSQFSKDGRSQRITGPGGEVLTASYDALGRVLKLTDPAGRSTVNSYRGDSPRVAQSLRPDGVKEQYRHDDQGRLLSLTIGGQKILQNSYSKDGLLLSSRGEELAETRFRYDEQGRLTAVSDALGNSTRFEYDARGNPVKETDPRGAVTRRQYDTLDRLVRETGPTGAITRYRYDQDGRLIQIIAADGSRTRFGYDKAGRLATLTDPLNRTHSYRYDAMGRLSGETDAGGYAQKYQYDARGKLQRWSDSRGRSESFFHDALGRLGRLTNAEGISTEYSYDAAGNPASARASDGSHSAWRYDTADRLSGESDAAGGSFSYAHDDLGRLTTVTGPLGHQQTRSYTPDGRLAGVTAPGGGKLGYEYDAAGRMTAIHHPGGGITRLAYDKTALLTSETDPLGRKRRHGYDLAGLQGSLVESDASVTRYSHDALGRLSAEQLADGRRIEYRYDKAGRRIAADDGRYAIYWRYDTQDRLLRVDYPAIKQGLSYRYGENERRSRLSLADGQVIGYRYDPQQRLSALVLPDGRKIKFLYDKAGRESAIQYPNGVTASKSYDARGEPVGIRYQHQKRGLIGEFAYRSDAAGNLIEARNGEQVTRYRYDADGQLTEVSGDAGKTRYRYDTGGNRKGLESAAGNKKYHHDKADQLIRAGKETLSYDPLGRLVSRQGADRWHYHYDREGRLAGASGPDGMEVGYGYDALGNRIWRRDRDGKRHFVYDGLNLVQILGPDLKPETSFVHAPAIDRPLAMLQDGKVYYYHADRLGSIRFMTDDSGAVVARYEYDAFGNPVLAEAGIPNPFSYTAREFDPVTGLYYYRARYYDPRLGRFLTKDPVAAPLEDVLGANPYLYAANNPLRYTDPLGESGTGFENDPWSTLNALLRSHKAELKSWQRSGMPKYAIDMKKDIISRIQQEMTKGRGGSGRMYDPNSPWHRTRAMKPPVPDPNRTLSGGKIDGYRPPPQTTTSGNPTRPLPSAGGPVKPGDTRALNNPSRPSSAGSGGRGAGWGARWGARIGGAAGAVAGGLNVAACVREGGSWAWCMAKAAAWTGVGMLGGAAIGAAAATAPAWVGAGLIAGGIGLTAYAGNNAWNRLQNAGNVAAVNQINQELFPAWLAYQQGQAAELRRLAADAEQKINQANAASLKAATTARDLQKSLDRLNTLGRQLPDGLWSSCIEWRNAFQRIETRAREAKDKARQANERFVAVIGSLEACIANPRGMGDAGLKTAESDLFAARRLAREAATAFTEANSNAQQIPSDFEQIPSAARKARETMAEFRKEQQKAELNGEALRGFIQSAESDATAAKAAIDAFETAKAKAMSNLNMMNLRAVLSQGNISKLNLATGQIGGIRIKASPRYKKNLQTASQALDAIPKHSVKDYNLMDKQFQDCQELQRPTDAILDAHQAFLPLDGKLDDADRKRDQCLAALQEDDPPVAGNPPGDDDDPPTDDDDQPPGGGSQPPGGSGTVGRIVSRYGVVGPRSCTVEKVGDSCGGYQALIEYADAPGQFLSVAATWPTGNVITPSEGQASAQLTANYQGMSDTLTVDIVWKKPPEPDPDPDPPAGGSTASTPPTPGGGGGGCSDDPDSPDYSPGCDPASSDPPPDDQQVSTAGGLGSGVQPQKPDDDDPSDDPAQPIPGGYSEPLVVEGGDDPEGGPTRPWHPPTREPGDDVEILAETPLGPDPGGWGPPSGSGSDPGHGHGPGGDEPTGGGGGGGGPGVSNWSGKVYMKDNPPAQLTFSIDPQENRANGRVSGQGGGLSLSGPARNGRIRLSGRYGQGKNSMTMVLEGSYSGSSARGSVSVKTGVTEEEIAQGVAGGIAAGIAGAFGGGSSSSGKAPAGKTPLGAGGSWSATAGN